VKRATEVTSIKTVFLGSSDPSVYAELPPWVGLEGVRCVHMNDSNLIVFSAVDAGAQKNGNTTVGMFLVAQTIIFSGSCLY
jgi:hypothetical protein